MSIAAEAIKQLTGRSCGSCSLCCKLLGINVAELRKPRNTWCAYCRPGDGGCGIYATRPDICREYACGWLLDPALGDEWQPARAKIVVNHEVNSSTGWVDCNFIVDPGFPGRWRQAPYHEAIRKTAFIGLNAINGRQFSTYIKVRDQTLFVLPRKEVDVTGRAHLAMCMGDEWEWEVKCFDSEERGRRIIEGMEKLLAKFKTMSPAERIEVHAELQRMKQEAEQSMTR